MATSNFQTPERVSGTSGAGLDKRRDAELMVMVNPGETLRNVILKVKTPEAANSKDQVKREMYPPKGQSMVWVRGTVRDEAGQFVANATVFVFGVEEGGSGRPTYLTQKATTDAQGRYEVTGPSGIYSFSATQLTISPGKSQSGHGQPFR